MHKRQRRVGLTRPHPTSRGSNARDQTNNRSGRPYQQRHEALRRRRHRGAGARRRLGGVREGHATPPSWARPEAASRRCCTASPVSTNSRSGQVYIGDIDLGSLSDKDLTLLRRKKVGFVFQSFNLIPTLSAKENILLPLLIAGDKEDDAWFDQVVGILGLGDRLSHRPSELSGGQQQRVAAARALVSRPDIIFADEPSGNLDSKSAAELLDFMRRAVKEFGQTIVMVTHDPVAASYADRIVFLEDGRIATRCTTRPPTRSSTG